jgi:hypothetical protein
MFLKRGHACLPHLAKEWALLSFLLALGIRRAGWKWRGGGGSHWEAGDSLVAPKFLLCCSDLRLFLEPSVALIVGEGVSHGKGHGEELLFLKGIIGILDLLELEG